MTYQSSFRGAVAVDIMAELKTLGAALQFALLTVNALATRHPEDRRTADAVLSLEELARHLELYERRLLDGGGGSALLALNEAGVADLKMVLRAARRGVDLGNGTKDREALGVVQKLGAQVKRYEEATTTRDGYEELV